MKLMKKLKNFIIDFNEILEDRGRWSFTLDCVVIKFKDWEKNKEKIRIFKIKTRKKIGFINSYILVCLSFNNYLEVKIKGFAFFNFLIGKLSLN